MKRGSSEEDTEGHAGMSDDRTHCEVSFCGDSEGNRYNTDPHFKLHESSRSLGSEGAAAAAGMVHRLTI